VASTSRLESFVTVSVCVCGWVGGWVGVLGKIRKSRMAEKRM
jgi:hypothetical protein